MEAIEEATLLAMSIPMAVVDWIHTGFLCLAFDVVADQSVLCIIIKYLKHILLNHSLCHQRIQSYIL